MSTTAMLALVLWSALVACVAFVLGAFHEYDRKGGSAEIRRELLKAWGEVEELKEVIWLISQDNPSSPETMPAGALPTHSVTVERSRHLHSVRYTKNEGGR